MSIFTTLTLRHATSGWPSYPKIALCITVKLAEALPSQSKMTPYRHAMVLLQRIKIKVSVDRGQRTKACWCSVCYVIRLDAGCYTRSSWNWSIATVRSDGSRRSPRKEEWFDDVEAQMKQDADLHDPDLNTSDIGLAKLPEHRSVYYWLNLYAVKLAAAMPKGSAMNEYRQAMVLLQRIKIVVSVQ